LSSIISFHVAKKKLHQGAGCNGGGFGLEKSRSQR
jgi:hypothetical protein